MRTERYYTVRSFVRGVVYTAAILAFLAVVGLANPLADLVINHINK